MEAQITKVALTADIAAKIEHPIGWKVLPFLKHELQSGIAECWQCEKDGHTLYVVTRLDFNPTEWVITWACGTGAKWFTPLFVAHARKKGWPLRIHVGDPARLRLFRRMGFNCDEYVMRA